MSYSRTVLVIFLLFTVRAHAGFCGDMVTSVAKAAYTVLDKSGRSYEFANALYRVERIANARVSIQVTASFDQLKEVDRDLRETPGATAEEKAGFYEEVANLSLRLARQQKETGVAFEGSGMKGLYLWLSRHAIYSQGRPQIQQTFVKAIRSLQNSEASILRQHLERLLIDMGAVAGFTPEAIELLDGISLSDKQMLTDLSQLNVFSTFARPMIKKWRAAVELEELRDRLVPALNDYTLKRELRGFSRWFEGHGPYDISLDGPNGYYDRTPRIRATMMSREDKRKFLNPLNAVLYQLLRYRILFGIHNLDRVVHGDEKREPLFVNFASYGALVILSYMSQERNLSEAEVEERRDLIKRLSGPEHGRLLRGAIEVGSANATAHFLAGNWSLDPLRDASPSFRKVMTDHFKHWEISP